MPATLMQIKRRFLSNLADAAALSRSGVRPLPPANVRYNAMSEYLGMYLHISGYLHMHIRHSRMQKLCLNVFSLPFECTGLGLKS